MRKLVLVHWIDSIGGNKWTPVNEVVENIDAYIKYISVGFILDETPLSLTLGQSLSLNRPDNEEMVEARITIPKRAITKRKLLKV